MAEASAHDKQMKYFVQSENFVLFIKTFWLNGVNYTAYCVDYAAGKKPSKGTVRKAAPQSAEYGQTYPAHGDVDYR